MNTAPIHCFEKSGLGKAGFRCVGVASIPSPSMAEQNPTAYMNAMAELPRDLHCGTCNYCGTAIMHNFIIESADRRRFVVGSDCVAKTGDAGLIKEVRRVRLVKAQEKRAAKRTMARAEREALWAIERADRAAIFIADNSELIERAKAFENNEFITSVITRGIAGGYVSDKAMTAVQNAIGNMEENARLRAASRHVGEVGKRYTFKVSVHRINSYERPAFGRWGNETVWIVTLRDEKGNAIVVKSPAFCPEKGETLTIKATVKEHSVYNTEEQTVVQRVKIME